MTASRFLFVLPVLALLRLHCVGATFSFLLPAPAGTSAGIFDSNGKLVRTLWSARDFDAGSFTSAWNGVDDDGRLASPGNYQARVLTNNCTYTWEGVIGNTSNPNIGPTVFSTYRYLEGGAITGGTVYAAAGYPEGGVTTLKFATTNPNAQTALLSKGGDTTHVATDGTTVYWAAYDSSIPDSSFVFATNVSDDLDTPLSAGAPFTPRYGRTFPSAIDTMTGVTGAAPGGIAVQPAGSWLFVSHPGLNELRVFNKTTGALQNTASIATPGKIACDAGSGLWLVAGPAGARTVTRYAVDAGGNLSAVLALPAAALSNPVALAASGSEILVADSGSSQQVKAFDAATGALDWTLGQLGGYAATPDVADDRFAFTDQTWLAVQSDGSFWIGDYGNDRTLQFSALRSHLQTQMYQPSTYSSAVDPNNPTRAFYNYLEFAIDYSKPLAADNGSWTLVRNWASGIPSNLDGTYTRMRAVTTLGNGRTYALQLNTTTSQYAVIELPPSGLVRVTNVEIPNTWRIMPDGCIRGFVPAPAGGGTAQWKQRDLTGFDGTGNPLWGSEYVIGSAPSSPGAPLWKGDINALRAGQTTSSGLIISFDQKPTNNWHLGAVPIGGTDFLWKAAPPTHPLYYGGYPDDGSFDIGNGVQKPGSTAVVCGRNIIWGYHGEFWKNAQTNKWTHVFDDGLVVKTFGENQLDYAVNPAAGTAGNAIAPSLVSYGGDLYLYHNDEFCHGGLHRWKIGNLSSITELTVPVVLDPDFPAGLNREVMSSADLNLDNTVTRTHMAQINENWSMHAPDGITNPDVFSIRWTGFLKPSTTETYTVNAETTGWCRVKIDGSVVCEGVGPLSGTAPLVADRASALLVEYTARPGAPSLQLRWSSPTVTDQLIPSSALLSPYPGNDLLYGVPNLQDLPSGVNQWVATPSLYSTDPSHFWRAYGKADAGNNYLHVEFKNTDPAVCTVARDLATTGPMSFWELNADVNYSGNYANHGTAGGQYLQVLDPSGKVIVRLYPAQIHYPDDYRLRVNASADLFQDAKTGFDAYNAVWHPLKITGRAGQITVNYGDYTTTVPPCDPSADWTRPSSLSVYCWRTTTGYSRIINIDQPHFTGIAQTPVSVLTANLDPSTTLPDDHGWTRTPTSNSSTVYAVTNGLTVDRNDPDVRFFFKAPVGNTAQYDRVLRSSTTSSSAWTLDGLIDYSGNTPNRLPTAAVQYLDMLDSNGRVIFRLTTEQVAYPGDYRMRINGQTVYQSDQTGFAAYTGQWRSIALSLESSGALTCRYDSQPLVSLATPFDPSADKNHPTKLRIYFWHNTVAGTRSVALKDFEFSEP